MQRERDDNGDSREADQPWRRPANGTPAGLRLHLLASSAAASKQAALSRSPRITPYANTHEQNQSPLSNPTTRVRDQSNPNRDNAHSRIRHVQSGQADSSPNLRRRGLRRQQGAEGRAGLDHQRAVGAEHDGAVGAGGAGQVLLPGGREPLGEVRTLEG
jgi:hypothetical protein